MSTTDVLPSDHTCPAAKRLALAIMLCLFAGAPTATARVLSIEIERRAPLLEGRAFAGMSGVPNREDRPSVAYEMIEGRIRFGFEPGNAANPRISDLEFAPVSNEGVVEA
jgi:hypothetical protein